MKHVTVVDGDELRIASNKIVKKKKTRLIFQRKKLPAMSIKYWKRRTSSDRFQVIRRHGTDQSMQ